MTISTLRSDNTKKATEEMCLGLIADTLFGEPLVGRPHLPTFLYSPDMHSADLSELGVDSLAWMGLMTRLEVRLGITFEDEFFSTGPINALRIARCAATLMESSRAQCK